VNFSVGLSFGVLLAGGEISASSLSASSLAANREAILSVFDRVTVEQVAELSLEVGGLSDLGIDPGQLFAGGEGLTLEGADFAAFQMRFPARVTLETTAGEEFTAEVQIPAGAPGRALDEIRTGVGGKFLGVARGVLRDPDGALEALLSFDSSPDVRAIVDRVVTR